MLEIIRKNEGFLAMSPKPAGFEKLHGAIALWRSAGVSTVISLLEPDEAADLGLALEGDACDGLGLVFCHFPVPDFGVPGEVTAYFELISTISTRIENGEGVLVHCRGGIGRSGTLAVAVLHQLGVKLEAAIELCSEKRGIEVPETAAQRAWLASNCNPSPHLPIVVTGS